MKKHDFQIGASRRGASLVLTLVAALTLVFAGEKAMAQPGGGGGGGMGGGFGGGGMGNFDPKQMAQTQVNSLRDSIGVTNDDDWKVISPLLLKVVQLQTDIQMADMARRMAPMMAQFGGGQGGPNPFGGQPDPTADALQKTLDDQAPTTQVKAALARFRDSKKQKQAEMTRAQDALKQVLSSRQEATLALMGILD